MASDEGNPEVSAHRVIEPAKTQNERQNLTPISQM
jgi:hypothetical protein